jgi:type IV secretory pathway VirB2 component (pilin)
MITKNTGKRGRSWRGNIGRYLLVAYLITTGICLLTGYNIFTLIGVLAIFAGIAILIKR